MIIDSFLAVLIPGVDLCRTYAIDPEDLVETYFSFIANSSNDMEVTDDILDEFERKELTKWKSKGNGRKNVTSKTQSNVDFNYEEMGSDGENDDVMSAYICTTPKVIC